MRFVLIALTVHLLSGCGTSPSFDGSSPRHEGASPQNEQASPASPENQDNREESPVSERSIKSSAKGNKVNSTEDRQLDLSKPGPHGIEVISASLEDAGYQSAVVYLPKTRIAGQLIPAMTVSGGLSNFKEDVEWLARHLASHGIIAIAFTPLNNLSVDPNIWSIGHKAALNKVLAENLRPASSLYQIVDRGKLGIMGFSMGGAGAIIAANELPIRLATTVAISPFLPMTPTASSPILLVAGTLDAVAFPEYVRGAFEGATAPASKCLLNVLGMSHQDVLSTGAYQNAMSHYISAWLKAYLFEDKISKEIFTDNGTRDSSPSGLKALAQVLFGN